MACPPAKTILAVTNTICGNTHTHICFLKTYLILTKNTKPDTSIQHMRNANASNNLNPQTLLKLNFATPTANNSKAKTN